MSTTVTVTPEELAALIGREVKHAEPWGISTLTDARARKRDNPFGVLHKLNRLSVFAGASYEASVNRARVRQGMEDATTAAPFVAQEPVWAMPVPGSPALRRHKTTGDLYLAVHVLSGQRPTYLYQRSGGYWSPVDKAKVLGYLPADQSESTAERQGLDRPVVFRTFKLASILSLRRKGVTYRIRRPGGVVVPPIRPTPYVSPLAGPISEAIKPKRPYVPKGITKEELPDLMRAALMGPILDRLHRQEHGEGQ